MKFNRLDRNVDPPSPNMSVLGVLIDIIDVVDEDDDIINDEDALPYDLSDSNDEDLINFDAEGVDKMSEDVARSCGGKDRPPPHYVPTSCGGCFANQEAELNHSGVTEEMSRLEATGTYTDDEINHLDRGNMFSQFESGSANRSGGCGDDEESADDQDDEDEDEDGDT
nr:hypothetical protein [Tanacetum cinerariifolium]